VEYRDGPECGSGVGAVTDARTSDPGPFRRNAKDSFQHELSSATSLSGCTQPPGRSNRRDRYASDSKSPDSILRATEHGSLDGTGKKHSSGSGDDGAIQRFSQTILDALSSGVILLDEHLLIAAMNPAAENILCISQTRAHGQSLLQLVDDEPEMRDILTRVRSTGDHYANELRLAPTEAHNEERIVDCRVSPIEIEGARLLLEMTDVTRRTQISRENALLIQHGAGRQMIRQLAHEIKNPLGGIRGAAQLLERQLADAELREYTDVVISETDRLAALVDTLLGPGGPPNKQSVNVHELLEYVVKIIQADDQRNVTIRRDYDPGLPNIDLDRDQIVQALLNLVRNAAASLDGQGTLILRSRAVTNFTIGNARHRVIASIEIEDDGPGIPPHMQDSVFYPLVTSRPDGTGLGLPAAQELLSRHKGLIEFDSRPGRTVFFVRIPLDQTLSDAND